MRVTACGSALIREMSWWFWRRSTRTECPSGASFLRWEISRGSSKGFLFPASLVIVGRKVYITNLSLPLTPVVGDEIEEEVDLFTVVKVEGIPGL